MTTSPDGAAPAAAHRVPTALGTIAVHEYAAHDPGAPTALLWHSMFTDSRSWSRVAPALARHRRLLVVDGPGYGASAELTRLSDIGECATAAVEVLDRLTDGVPATWSVGTATATDGDSLATLLARADAALYREKHRRRTG